jgi:hypothetical protein
MIGCAATPDPKSGPAAGGESQGVVSEVANVGRINLPDGTRTRWSYTIILRETAGRPVNFEWLERASYNENLEVGGAPVRTTFTYRLAANSEMRYGTSDSWGYGATAGTQFGGITRLGDLTVVRRFIGKDASGNQVVVPVRVILHRGLGRLSRQPPSTAGAIPGERRLRPEELASLAGRWEGFYTDRGFQVPVEFSVAPDGRLKLGDNDPVTHTLDAALSIRDGRVFYSGRETGELKYHEGANRRLLVGAVGRPPVAGAATGWSFPVQVEWVVR